MRKGFKFRIYPSKKQIKDINLFFILNNFLYNSALEHRIYCWQKKIKTNYFDQANQLREIKELFPEYKLVNAQVLQSTLKRLDSAYQNFFRRVKTGQTPGFPRFKSIVRNSSFTYPQYEFLVSSNKLKLSKIGLVKIKLHRKIIGKIKTCTISRDSTGKYFAAFSVEIPDVVKQNKFDNIIGIDLGVKTFAVDNLGNTIDNPKVLKQYQDKLAKAQRKLAKIKKLVQNKEKRLAQKNHVARLYSKIANVREDFLHKTSKKLVNDHDVLILEKLNIVSMVDSNSWKNLNRSIMDCAWRKLTDMIIYKAAEAGKNVIFVDARGTSQACSGCGNIVAKDLSVRIHDCSSCGLVIDRDLNAARNIYNRGMSLLDIPRKSRNILFESSKTITLT